MVEENHCAGIGEIGLRHYDKRWRRGGSQHELSLMIGSLSPAVQERFAYSYAKRIYQLL